MRRQEVSGVRATCPDAYTMVMEPTRVKIFLSGLHSETAIPVCLLAGAVACVSWAMASGIVERSPMKASERLRWRLYGWTMPSFMVLAGWFFFCRAPAGTPISSALAFGIAAGGFWYLLFKRLDSWCAADAVARPDPQLPPVSSKATVIVARSVSAMSGAHYCDIGVNGWKAGELHQGCYLELHLPPGGCDVVIETPLGRFAHRTSLAAGDLVLLYVRSSLRGFTFDEKRPSSSELSRLVASYQRRHGKTVQGSHQQTWAI